MCLCSRTVENMVRKEKYIKIRLSWEHSHFFLSEFEKEKTNNMHCSENLSFEQCEHTWKIPTRIINNIYLYYHPMFTDLRSDILAARRLKLKLKLKLFALCWPNKICILCTVYERVTFMWDFHSIQFFFFFVSFVVVIVANAQPDQCLV